MAGLSPTRPCDECKGVMDLKNGPLPSTQETGAPVRTGQYYRCRDNADHVFEVAAISD
jgi:hypothetical protein